MMQRFAIPKGLRLALFIAVLQIATISLMVILQRFAANDLIFWLSVGIAAIIFNLLYVVWLSSILRATHDDAVAQTTASFVQEQEQIQKQINAQFNSHTKKGKNKSKTNNQTPDYATTDETGTHFRHRNDPSPGRSFAGVAGLVMVGGIVMLSQLIAVGLIAIAAIGGVVAGYVAGYSWRSKQSLPQQRNHETLINGNVDMPEMGWERRQKATNTLIRVKQPLSINIPQQEDS